MTRLYVHDLSIFDMTRSSVTWLIHLWYDSFICDMTHSSVTWLIHILWAAHGNSEVAHHDPELEFWIVTSRFRMEMSQFRWNVTIQNDNITELYYHPEFWIVTSRFRMEMSQFRIGMSQFRVAISQNCVIIENCALWHPDSEWECHNSGLQYHRIVWASRILTSIELYDIFQNTTHCNTLQHAYNTPVYLCAHHRQWT